MLQGEAMFSRITAFVYGSVCYLVFFATFLYAIGFLGNFGVPRPMDTTPRAPFWEALIIDLVLLGVFAVQHSVMARPWFKRMWTRIVPEPVERSTYVLFSSVALILVFWQWKPTGGVIWRIQNGVANAMVLGLYAAGLLIVLLATFLINHF